MEINIAYRRSWVISPVQLSTQEAQVQPTYNKSPALLYAHFFTTLNPHCFNWGVCMHDKDADLTKPRQSLMSKVCINVLTQRPSCLSLRHRSSFSAHTLAERRLPLNSSRSASFKARRKANRWERESDRAGEYKKKKRKREEDTSRWIRFPHHLSRPSSKQAHALRSACTTLHTLPMCLLSFISFKSSHEDVRRKKFLLTALTCTGVWWKTNLLILFPMDYIMLTFCDAGQSLMPPFKTRHISFVIIWLKT